MSNLRICGDCNDVYRAEDGHLCPLSEASSIQSVRPTIWMIDWVDELRQAGISAAEAMAHYDEQYGIDEAHGDLNLPPQDCARKWLLKRGLIPQTTGQPSDA